MELKYNSLSIKKNHLYDFLYSIKHDTSSSDNIKQQLMLLPNIYKNNIEIIDIKDFIIIKTHDISDNLRHENNTFDKILHQMKTCVIDKSTYKPLIYIDKPIQYTDNVCSNSYLKNYVYDTYTDFNNTDFDNNNMSIYKNYIGSYIVLFTHNNIWKFLFSDNIYTFDIKNHYILYSYLHKHIDKLDNSKCYHLLITDTRLRNLISHNFINNEIILIKTTIKYTLEEDFNNIYDFFTTNKKIYVSCFDELNIYLETLDNNNINLQKISYKGVIMKINIEHNDSIYIQYNTNSYTNLLNILPKYLNIHEIYMYLYQCDKLSHILSYINDSSSDIIKRINISMGTISREIIDIYHMTRNQNNSELYNLLPMSYKQILYYLHSDYIEQKTCDTENKQKISITVDNVYNKLKNIDYNLLVSLYRERNKLIDNIFLSTYKTKNPLKYCVYTQIQSNLLL